MSLSVPIPIDIIVGEKVVRKLLITLAFEIASEDIVVWLTSMESHDIYLKPIAQESLANDKKYHIYTFPINIVSTYLDPGCLGLSSPNINIKEERMQVDFNKADAATCSQIMYARAFFLELSK